MAEVGWAISTLGWIASPIITRLLATGFELLGFDESEKLQDLEARILPRLAQLMEQADRIPPGKRAHLEQWANKLRSAFYDAEDILDVADYHRLEKQVISRAGAMPTLQRAKHVFSRKTSRLRKILTKLEKIIEEGSHFLPPLVSTIGNVTNGNDISNPANKTIITTTSYPTHIIIGRDKERDEIVRMLRVTSGDCGPSSSNIKCYSVIGIYGVGGSGKTTLAQHVCSYERSDNYFFPVMWIHISQSFSVDKIYRKMFEAASGKPPEELNNLDTLQMKLEEELTGKRFFLVLDDIWAEKNVRMLDQLLCPLKVGKRGSKVLVTTRSRDAAMSLGAQSLMQIPDLNQKDFFELFMHYALDHEILDSQELETLQMIGGEIMKKLKGSPLAARLVGARLRKQSNAMFWRRVGDQHLLSDTLGALWWSYQQLDEQIKRCFSYCSMFPPGHVFKRDYLVKLWMAEGFIKNTHSIERMENLGQDYFDELVSFSFLQAKQGTDGSDNNWFSMHDLLHELAVMVGGKDSFRVERGDQIKEFPPDVRHLFVRSHDPMKLTEQICRLKKLRTLIIITYDGLWITMDAFEHMLKKLRKLRVVQVHANADCQMLMFPACICDLKHLRSLTFSGFRLKKVHLPRNLDKLYHLQILHLPVDGVLDFSHVKNMRNLVNLWHIRNSGHPLNYSDISSSPGVGELMSLRELSDFKMRTEKGYEMQQLASLGQLRGSLRISGLENADSRERALEAKLADKEYLTELSLIWSSDVSLVQQRCSTDIQLEILEGLRPPSQLTKLQIYGYGGCNYPSWLTQSFRSLKCVKLEKCSNLKALPNIAELFIHLHTLALFHLPKLEGLPRLPDSLKNLDIQHCQSLVLTCAKDMEMIRSLLIGQPSKNEPQVNIMTRPEDIDRFLHEQPDKFDAIVSDTSGKCDRLRRMLIGGQIRRDDDYSHFLFPASLNRIILSGCAITDTVLQNCLRGSTSLTSLTLAEIPFMISIPSEVMRSLAMLQDLLIVHCPQLTCLQGLSHLNRLQNLSIFQCPKLMAIQEDEKVQALGTLYIDDIPLLPKLLSRECFSSIRTICFLESKELREEDVLQQHFASLTSLKEMIISSCDWDRLPGNLRNLRCLERLILLKCMAIRSLPTLPASLRYFRVDSCDQSFMKSCQTKGDPNCQKIANVPRKEFVPARIF